MKLVDRWQEILRHSLSVRLVALGFVIIVTEPVITALVALYTGPNIWVCIGLNLLAGLVALAGIYARVVAQDKIETIVKPEADRE